MSLLRVLRLRLEERHFGGLVVFLGFPWSSSTSRKQLGGILLGSFWPREIFISPPYDADLLGASLGDMGILGRDGSRRRILAGDFAMQDAIRDSDLAGLLLRIEEFVGCSWGRSSEDNEPPSVLAVSFDVGTLHTMSKLLRRWCEEVPDDDDGFVVLLTGGCGVSWALRQEDGLVAEEGGGGDGVVHLSCVLVLLDEARLRPRDKERLVALWFLLLEEQLDRVVLL